MFLLYMGTNQDFFLFFLLSVLQHHEMLCEYICIQKPLSMAVETGNTEEGGCLHILFAHTKGNPVVLCCLFMLWQGLLEIQL